MQRLPGRLTIIDRRTAEAKQLTLTDWRAEAYDACGDTAHTPARVTAALVSRGVDVSVERVTRFLDECCHVRSEEHTSELQSRENLVCRLLLEKKKKIT